jgi:hypothetical protein
VRNRVHDLATCEDSRRDFAHADGSDGVRKIAREIEPDWSVAQAILHTLQ